MNKKLSICIALILLIVGCKKVTVDFSYSPSEPKAGESIKFTNNSSAGESWMWTFGDNSTSRTKHPTKVYRKPGTYMVTLMVDSAKNKTLSKPITIYDTIPTYLVSEDSILIYYDVTLTTNVYNPYGHTLTYDWQLPPHAVLQAGKLDQRSIEVYFTTAGEHKVKLLLTQKDKVFEIERTLVVHAVEAPAIVMRRADGSVMRQRLINGRLDALLQGNAEDEQALAIASDTSVIFNGITFYASQLPKQVPAFAHLTISHVQIDAMAQKWYIVTTDGLYVANFDGEEMVLVDADATGAICVDANRNRIYWANTNGVYAMPLVKSKNNQFTTTAAHYNDLSDVELITVNNTLQ